MTVATAYDPNTDPMATCYVGFHCNEGIAEVALLFRTHKQVCAALSAAHTPTDPMEQFRESLSRMRIAYKLRLLYSQT